MASGTKSSWRAEMESRSGKLRRAWRCLIQEQSRTVWLSETVIGMWVGTADEQTQPEEGQDLQFRRTVSSRRWLSETSRARVWYRARIG